MSKFFSLYAEIVFLIFKLLKIISCYILNVAPRKWEIMYVVCIWASISPPLLQTAHRNEDTVIRAFQFLVLHLSCRETKTLCSMSEERESSLSPLSS